MHPMIWAHGNFRKDYYQFQCEGLEIAQREMKNLPKITVIICDRDEVESSVSTLVAYGCLTTTLCFV